MSKTITITGSNTWISDVQYSGNLSSGGGGGGGAGGGNFAGGHRSYDYFSNQTIPYQWNTVQTITPSAPIDGELATINGKLYRYSTAVEQWIEVVDAPQAQIEEAPKLPVILDASKMLRAFKAYQDFLEDLELELPVEQQEAVRQVLYGLEEAIEGLEKI